MRRHRSIVAAAAGLLLLGAGGCLDDPPTAPGDGLALRLQVRLASALVERPLRVRVSFVGDDGESLVDLPVSPSQITVTGGEASERRVGVRLERCFAESPRTREDGSAYCRVAVQLESLASGEGGTGDAAVVSEMQFVDVDAGDRGPIVVPAFNLGGITLSGIVRDALDNAPVAGVSVGLHAGTEPSGAPIATSVTGSDGAYLFFGVTAGTYTLAASGTGFLSTTMGPVTVGTQSEVADIVVSPVLATNELRVVLTWGATPTDVDSHLYGPASAGSYHIYWQATDALPYAALDRDDIDSFGPETITIRTQAAGSHVYAVHDFTNQLSGTSSALGASGARVQVYRSTGLVADFTVPRLPGTLWTVFTLDGGTITPVNRMSFGDPAMRPAVANERRTAPVATGPSLSRHAPLLLTKPSTTARP